MHGSGVLVYCLALGIRFRQAPRRTVQLARASGLQAAATANSSWGGCIATDGVVWRVPHVCRHNLRFAASQGLDAAQCKLGDMHPDVFVAARDPAEAMRWWQLAGAPGNPIACCAIGCC